jgi:hypothetical protein
MMQNTDNKPHFYATQDVDTYTGDVDHLMDDLFGDVESSLHVDRTKQRSLQPKNSQPNQNRTLAPFAAATASSSDIVTTSKLEPAKDTVNITKLNIADISLPPISKQDILWIQPYIVPNPEPSNSFAPPETTEPKSRLLDRLLLVFACSSALIAAIMWTINHGIWLGRQSVNIAPIPTKEITNNQAFGEEIKRMLSQIVDKNRAIATNPNNTIISNLPLMTAPLIGTLPSPINGMQQPMYVPLYQPPTLNSGNTPLAMPPLTSNNSVDISNPYNPATSATSSQPIVATPQSYTLIGILDLGDRSTAMFDMNGSVQSIGLGKAIGNTGWNLSRISQQEITLKRGKETKSVFVGQKF